MSEEIPAEVPAEAPKKKKKYSTPTVDRKRRVSVQMALAILAVHERKQFGYHVNVREIATRHKVSPHSVRESYHYFLHGKIEMPIKPTPLDELKDRRALYERMRFLSLRIGAMVANQMEEALAMAEIRSGLSGMNKSKADENRNYRKINDDVMFLARAMQTSIALQNMVDQGYSSHLDEMHRLSTKQTPINPILPVGAAKQTAMLNAGETARALQALEGPIVEEGK